MTAADRPEVDDPRVLALAKARQQMAHENPFNAGFCPPWDELSEQEQRLDLLDARNYLRAALKAGLFASSAVSVVPPATNQAAEARDRIAQVLADADGWRWADGFKEQSPTWQRYQQLADAVLAGLPAPVDRAAVLRWGADELGRMDYDTDSHDYGYDTYRDAWNGGVMDGADLLRRLADEAAVVPPPALTEEGRLRAQVEVLQQDAERDRGLAKVGARCMRVGHQGLIEQGRLVLEGWRFALSTALGLGTGAPWEAIHERAKELAAEAPQTETRPRRGYAVDQWLKAQRDEYEVRSSPQWGALDEVLDTYRLHADMGASLGEHVCEGRMVGDCECLEQPDAPAVVAQPGKENGRG